MIQGVEPPTISLLTGWSRPPILWKISVFDPFFQIAVAATIFELSTRNQDQQFFKTKKVEGAYWHFPKFPLLIGII